MRSGSRIPDSLLVFWGYRRLCLSSALGSMTTLLRVIVFGSVSGALWTIMLMLMANHSANSVAAETGQQFSVVDRSTAVLLAFGISTGILVSLSLWIPVSKSRLLPACLLGLAALPFGGFVFGFLMGLWGTVTGGLGGAHGLVERVAAPFVIGMYAASVSIAVLWCWLPIGVINTLILRAVTRHRQANEAAA
jgi:hypothetical protein